MDIVDDLEAEQERLESLLGQLSDEEWAAASAAPGGALGARPRHHHAARAALSGH